MGPRAEKKSIYGALRRSFLWRRICGGSPSTPLASRPSRVKKHVFSTPLSPRAIVHHKLKAKGRALPLQLNFARVTPREPSTTFFFISSFRFGGGCRRVASRAVADEVMGEWLI
jgi:hypothetical protein